MRRLLSIIAIIGIVLPALSSCRAISDLLHNGEVVAQVGKERLYRSDIDEVVPKGISVEDSIALARQIIDVWASDRIYLAIAEEQLSKAEEETSISEVLEVLHFSIPRKSSIPTRSYKSRSLISTYTTNPFTEK